LYEITLKGSDIMANNFLLTLDTLGPQSPSIEIASGASAVTTQLVSVAMNTSDGSTSGYSMKIWGDVDTTNDEDVQTSENGTPQVETAVVSVTTVVTGNVDLTVVGAGIGGSPLGIQFGVSNGDIASDVATKMRTALNVAGVTTNYNIGGSGANVTLTSKTAQADDPTLNIAIEGNATGVDDLTYSTSTTPGVKASSWQSYNATLEVKLSSGNGTKTLYLKIRDDVGNVSSQANDSVTLDTEAPTVVIMTGPTPAKISKIAGYNSSVFAWQVDEDFVEYKVKVVANSGDIHTAGTLIPTTAGSVNMSDTGSFPAETNINSTVKGTDLETASSGDGEKIVKVFVKDIAGNWST
jgi:hypothetical protein